MYAKLTYTAQALQVSVHKLHKMLADKELEIRINIDPKDPKKILYTPTKLAFDNQYAMEHKYKTNKFLWDDIKLACLFNIDEIVRSDDYLLRYRRELKERGFTISWKDVCIHFEGPWSFYVDIDNSVIGEGFNEYYMTSLWRIVEELKSKLMTFGKYKGHRLVDLPSDYVEWLMNTKPENGVMYLTQQRIKYFWDEYSKYDNLQTSNFIVEC